MASRFEDLGVWQKARGLALDVYEVTKQRAFASDPSLRDQLRRAVVSVMSNIAEGVERDSDPELGRFLAIAKGSCGEVRCQLYVALDQHYIHPEQFRDLSNVALEVSRMLHGLRQRTRTQKSKKCSRA